MLFSEMIAANENMIFKIAALYTNAPEDREDLIQEIALQLWKSFDSFQQRSSRSTWLYRVAMNTAIQYLKREKRAIKTSESLTSAKEMYETNATDTEEKIRLMQAIQRLNQLDRGIILLYLEARSYQEIAEIVGISISNVGTRIQRIKHRLKEELNHQK